jgi:hypothetical protein
LPLCYAQHNGQSYARLRFHVGPGGDIELPVEVDWSKPFAGSDHRAWQDEYQGNVEAFAPLVAEPPFGHSGTWEDWGSERDPLFYESLSACKEVPGHAL